MQEIQAKMQEYIANGLQLGWLINPKDQQVIIYHPHQTPLVLQSPTNLSGEDVLSGLILNLQLIFSDSSV